MDMLGNEYAIRDLKIRVKHSELSRKDELGKELDQLIGLTTRTSEYVSTTRINDTLLIDYQQPCGFHVTSCKRDRLLDRL